VTWICLMGMLYVCPRFLFLGIRRVQGPRTRRFGGPWRWGSVS
jgi:hypothetical protein